MLPPTYRLHCLSCVLPTTASNLLCCLSHPRIFTVVVGTFNMPLCMMVSNQPSTLGRYHPSISSLRPGDTIGLLPIMLLLPTSTALPSLVTLSLVSPCPARLLSLFNYCSHSPSTQRVQTTSSLILISIRLLSSLMISLRPPPSFPISACLRSLPLDSFVKVWILFVCHLSLLW